MNTGGDASLMLTKLCDRLLTAHKRAGLKGKLVVGIILMTFLNGITQSPLATCCMSARSFLLNGCF